MYLFCPFPAVRNPATSWAETHTYEWALAWGLLPDRPAQEAFASACFAELMGRAYPHAERDLLALIADWNSWTFLVDTQLDHHALGRDPDSLGRFTRATMAILGDEPCPVDPHWPPLLHALAELTGRLRGYGTAAWLRRFRQNVGATLEACIQEARYRRDGALVSEEIYLHMRPHTSGVYCFLDLIELAEAAPLPDAVRADSRIVTLTALATEAIFLANDIASVHKERLQGDGNNLVLIAEHERRLAPDEAERYVYTRYVRAVGAFLHLRDRLPSVAPDADQALAHYVVGLEYWMRANLDWSDLTGRYRQPRAEPSANMRDEELYADVAYWAREVGRQP